MARKSEGKSFFTFENEEELLDNLEQEQPKLYDFISNIEEYFTSYFANKDNEQKLLILKDTYINLIYSDKKTDDKKLKRSFCHILLNEMEDGLPINVKEILLSNMNKLDIKFIYMEKIIINMIQFLENKYTNEFKFMNYLKSNYTYDNNNRYVIINGFNLLKNDLELFNLNKSLKLEDGNLDFEAILINNENNKNKKLEDLKNKLEEYKKIDNNIEKIDKKYELAEIIFNITDELKTNCNIEEIKAIFNEYLSINETNIIFDIYTSNFYIEKTNDFLKDIDTKNEIYISPLSNDRQWLKIAPDNKSILINFLENVKQTSLSEYLPLIDSIIEINYKNENFLEKLKNIQEEIVDIKNEKKKETILIEYINDIIGNYSKRFKLQNNEIKEMDKQTRLDINNGEINFFVAGAGELDGVCFDDKDNPTVFFVNFCTIKKHTSEQQQIFQHLPKFKEYVEKNYGISNVVPKVFNQSFIPDTYMDKSKKNWYRNEKIKFNLLDKVAINVLTSLEFMFHPISNIGIKTIEEKALEILNDVKLQPFDTKDLDGFNSLNNVNEKFDYIIVQTTKVAKFLAINHKHLSSENYTGNKKDLYMSFFDSCLFIEGKLDEITKEQFKNHIKNTFKDIWNDKDIKSISTSFETSNRTFDVFLKTFGLKKDEGVKIETSYKHEFLR